MSGQFCIFSFVVSAGQRMCCWQTSCSNTSPPPAMPRLAMMQREISCPITSYSPSSLPQQIPACFLEKQLQERIHSGLEVHVEISFAGCHHHHAVSRSPRAHPQSLPVSIPRGFEGRFGGSVRGHTARQGTVLSPKRTARAGHRALGRGARCVPTVTEDALQPQRCSDLPPRNTSI